MSKFTNKDIAEVLGVLRTGIRNGTTIYDGKLRDAVKKAFGGGEFLDIFTAENFNPQTLKRFEILFNVPREPQTGISQIKAWRYPSQDDYAWALQNFINRRANPWAHVEAKNTTIEPSTIPAGI